jgi:transposase
LAGERKGATPTNIMTKQKINNSKARVEQVTSTKPQTIKLGLDVHADSIVVVRIVDHSGPQPAQKFRPAQFREWVQGQQRLADQVHSCYEAGPFGYGLHRELVELGVHNRVVQPVCLDERPKGVNHDPSDVQELALRLDRQVAGNTHALATVRVPTPAEEQKRIASRQREQLKRAILRLAAQGRSLLLTQGYRAQRGWWGARRWAELEVQLPAWLVQHLEVFRRLLTALTVELDAATTALEAAAPTVRPKGLGGLTYEVIEREVGDWGRFANRRQVASYTGRCGGLSASGQSRHLLPITKHGNVRLRTALVELAWRLVVWQRDCKLVRKWWPVPGQAKATRAARKKAIVAIARQLAVDCWRWRTGRVTPQALGWVMVSPPA